MQDKVWTREEMGRLEDCSSPSSKLKRLLFSDSPTPSDSQSEQESRVSSKSPSFSTGESSNLKSKELKELVHILVVGQTQLREDIQQMFSNICYLENLKLRQRGPTSRTKYWLQRVRL